MASSTKPKKRVVMRGLCKQCKISPRMWAWKGSCVTRPEGILSNAADEGHPNCIEISLRAGANVNRLFDVYNYGTALMTTSQKGYLQCVKLLLKEGANVNEWNSSGHTALIFAARNGHAEVVSALIGAGADVNHRDSCGLTSLLTAADAGHYICVNLLIKGGADVNMDRAGVTPLMMAVTAGYKKCMELLLQAGPDVHQANYPGNTLLHMAVDVDGKDNEICCSTILKIVRAVLQSGARVNVLNKTHLTPLGSYSNKRKERFGPFMRFSCLNWFTSEPCSGDCERKTIKILLAAGERASDNSYQIVNAVKPVRELTLKELSIEAIRNHLLKLDPHTHLFDRVPQLGLPPLLTEYLLYGVSLDDDSDNY